MPSNISDTNVFTPPGSNATAAEVDQYVSKTTDAVQTVTITGKRLRTNVLQKDGKITQTERLFSTRARYTATDPQSVNTNIEASRGQWAYMKLMTSTAQAKEYSSKQTSTRDVAFKELIGQDSAVSKMADATGNKKSGYDKFLITGVSCSMSEKIQISEVFGDNEVVYYFGHQPMVFNLNGLLIDSVDNDWLTTWLQMYSDFLRGSQTAKNYELIRLVLPNMILTGTISGFNWSQDASRDTDIPFSMQFIAKVIEPLPTLREGMVLSNGLSNVDFSQAYKLVSKKEINSLKNQFATLTSVIQDPLSTTKDRADALSQLGTGLGGAFGSFLNASSGTITQFQSTVEGWDQTSKSTINGLRNSAMFQTVTSSLNGIRTNLFSPIYGVLSSLTKLVSNTLNSANALVNSAINPVRNILRDITNISVKATALVNLVNSSITAFGRNVTGQLKGVEEDYKTAIKSLKQASGAIGTAPKSVSNTIAHMFSNGLLNSNTAFLKSSPKLTFNSPSLTLSSSIPVSKTALLSGVLGYTSATANSL